MGATWVPRGHHRATTGGDPPSVPPWVPREPANPSPNPKLAWGQHGGGHQGLQGTRRTPSRAAPPHGPVPAHHGAPSRGAHGACNQLGRGCPMGYGMCVAVCQDMAKHMHVDMDMTAVATAGWDGWDRILLIVVCKSGCQHEHLDGKTGAGVIPGSMCSALMAQTS